MPRKLPEIHVQLLGRHWPRFVLARSDQMYWTGHGWTPFRRRALLYAHLDVVRGDRLELIGEQRRRRGRRR
jgi:hypothetical protein